MRNNVRDAFNSIVSTYKVESVYGSGKAKVLKEVNQRVNNELNSQGIIVDKIYLIGSIRLPSNVIDSLNRKIQAIQLAEQTEYELRNAKAVARKQVAIAKGEAEANKLRSVSITKTMIEYERVLNERDAISKWNGQLPTTIPPGSTMPFIGLGK